MHRRKLIKQKINSTLTLDIIQQLHYLVTNNTLCLRGLVPRCPINLNTTLLLVV